MPEPIPEVTTARLSGCGRYRYTLSRAWGDGPMLAWVMLNPSVADATIDDPTIRRVRGFSRSLGFDGFTVVNLFALRSVNPKALLTAEDPVGPDNDRWLARILATSLYDCVIAAWGAVDHLGMQRAAVLRHAFRDAPWHHLGELTKTGHPRHPLYLAADTPLHPWPYDETTSDASILTEGS